MAVMTLIILINMVLLHYLLLYQKILMSFSLGPISLQMLLGGTRVDILLIIHILKLTMEILTKLCHIQAPLGLLGFTQEMFSVSISLLKIILMVVVF